VIFEADPEQIEALDSKDLVRLMKLLLLAESRLAKIPLRLAHVPLQITVADEGEDGRVQWSGGVESTPYFPKRYCIFQAKATNLTEASVRSEILKQRSPTRKRTGRRKPNVGKTKPRAAAGVLSGAVSTALKKHGAYTILSSRAFTGQKREKLKKAIGEAARDGGENPTHLTIEILDANKIADWVNCHPPVALWLAEHTRRRSLAGFQSHNSWGKSADIRAAPWVQDTTQRFVAVNVVIEGSRPGKPKHTAWTFEEAAEAVLQKLQEDEQSVRLVGPSGFGKSRVAYEIFNRHAALADEVDTASVIYADYSVVGDEVAKLALEIAEGGSPTIFVVDECPDELHRKLSAMAQRADSHLRVLTIDVETRIVHAEKTMTIQLEQASNEMISAIAKGVDPKIEDPSVRLIQDLAHGFPQMAVLAARQKGSGKKTIRSAEQYLDRVLWGHRSPNADAQKALSILSLFDWVGLGGRVSEQATFIAERLAQMSFETFVEHIKSFRTRGIIVFRGDFVQIQPIPLAARLAASRLELLPDGKLLAFFNDAPAGLQKSLLKRIRWLDTVAEARALAANLLRPEMLGNYEVLNTDKGSEALDQLVHVDPDCAMATIDEVFGALSVEQLAHVIGGRRHLVWALEKLTFRKRTFERAARLLRRLGAAEIEERIGNNAAGQFKGLFHLYLSGTEAEPEIRLRILDEGLQSSNAKERGLCIDALDGMLESGHFSRSGGSEDIGTAEPLKDWQPATYGDIRKFYRAAVSRLMTIALSNDPFSDKAKTILGGRIRTLLNQFEPKEIKSLIDSIVKQDGFWQEAVQKINERLYFDGKNATPEIRQEVRRYFDDLLPTDPVELVVMYCHGWHVDFHDPDSTYSGGSSHNFDYSVRKSVELANVICTDRAAVERAVKALAASDAKSAGPFAHRLAERVSDPVALFKNALDAAEATDKNQNTPFCGGIISGADTRDPQLARDCVRAALRSPKLKANAIRMIGSGKLRTDDLELVVSLLQSGDVEPWECASLSYGRGLDHLTSAEISPLLNELMQHRSTGLWTALDIVFMYLFPAKTPDPLLEKILRSILVAPELFDRVNRRTMDGHHLEQAVALLAKHGMLEGRYVTSLVRRMLALTNAKDSDIFFELDDPVRNVLITLMTNFPNQVWSEIAPRLLAEGPERQYRLEQLIRPSRQENFGAGLLYGIPPNTYLDWVRKNPADRAGKVAHWLPIASKNEDGSLNWHPAIESFVTEFGGQAKVLNEIGSRLHPSSWWGSMVPHIEPWLRPLNDWLAHPRAEVRTWAQLQIEYIGKLIAAEQKRDEEIDVRL
jgi:hypothetical protein